MADLPHGMPGDGGPWNARRFGSNLMSMHGYALSASTLSSQMGATLTSAPARKRLALARSGSLRSPQRVLRVLRRGTSRLRVFA